MFNIDKYEDSILCEYGFFSRNSKGRKTPIKQEDDRGAFQKDRDKILHSKAFRRLKHKTQVFLSPYDDHYRTRMTHTLEVSQIARTIARQLRLNEDLVEAMSLGHDIGHTPFGHAGERVLNDIMGSFHHNEQSVRVVEYIENEGKGLNLTHEVKEGILTHRSRCTPKTLEGWVVRLSDKIAYINHDIDDAIRAGLITMEDLPKNAIAVVGDTHSKRISTMIADVVTNSYDKPEVVMSDEVALATKELRNYMFKNIYDENAINKREEKKAYGIIEMLFDYYEHHIDKLPMEFLNLIGRWGEKTVVCDFVAGMTDTYAVETYNQLFIPKFWR